VNGLTNGDAFYRILWLTAVPQPALYQLARNGSPKELIFQTRETLDNVSSQSKIPDNSSLPRAEACLHENEPAGA